MKKIFLMAILFFCINSVGQAKINDLQIAIGDVQIGNTKEYVKIFMGILIVANQNIFKMELVAITDL